MPHYFIIDRNRNMSVMEGADRSDAVERYNDKNKVKADVCIDAEKCHHGKFKKPLLPEWMEHFPTNCKYCYSCNDKEESIIPVAETGIFQHKRNWL